MENTERTSLRFTPTHKEFTKTLNKRVGEYFKNHNLDRHGNAEMIIKTVVMFILYFLPYGLVLSGVITSGWGIIIAGVVMSLGISGIGLSVMHDANHGAYSSKKWVNMLMGYSLNLVGANSFNWKIQHNVLHHSYTNVHETDEDISPRGVIRMSPHAEWKWIHKFQHFYAWILYGLMTIVWIFAKDFVRIVKYSRNGLAKKQNANVVTEWFILLGTKILYVGHLFVIPLIFTDIVWWHLALGIIGMHYLSGFFLAIVFQPAHVAEETAFPLPDEDNMLEETWAVHQLRTTTNFGNESRWFSWFIGGLNFQIEHHLFPNVCHVHYRKISKIVRSTAEEFDLPYYSTKTFLGALISHFRHLRQMGMRPERVRANN